MNTYANMINKVSDLFERTEKICKQGETTKDNGVVVIRYANRTETLELAKDFSKFLKEYKVQKNSIELADGFIESINELILEDDASLEIIIDKKFISEDWKSYLTNNAKKPILQLMIERILVVLYCSFLKSSTNWYYCSKDSPVMFTYYDMNNKKQTTEYGNMSDQSKSAASDIFGELIQANNLFPSIDN